MSEDEDKGYKIEIKGIWTWFMMLILIGLGFFSGMKWEKWKVCRHDVAFYYCTKK